MPFPHGQRNKIAHVGGAQCAEIDRLAGFVGGRINRRK